MKWLHGRRVGKAAAPPAVERPPTFAPPAPPTAVCQADVSRLLLERLPEFCEAEGEEAPLPQLILGQFRWWARLRGLGLLCP